LVAEAQGEQTGEGWKSPVKKVEESGRRDSLGRKQEWGGWLSSKEAIDKTVGARPKKGIKSTERGCGNSFFRSGSLERRDFVGPAAVKKKDEHGRGISRKKKEAAVGKTYKKKSLAGGQGKGRQDAKMIPTGRESSSGGKLKKVVAPTPPEKGRHYQTLGGDSLGGVEDKGEHFGSKGQYQNNGREIFTTRDTLHRTTFRENRGGGMPLGNTPPKKKK